MADISKIQIESGTYDIKDTTARSNISTLDNNILTELVVFGDSWSDPAVTEDVWSTCVAGELAVNLHNYAKNGAGFIKPTTNLISTQVTTAENDSNLNKNKVKYVVFCGGINDYRNDVTVPTLRSEIGNLVDRSKALFPHAKILYVNNFQYPYTGEQSAYWYQLEYTLSSWNVLVLNQDGYIRKEYFLSNLYHLTIYGQRLFATNIASALSGGHIKNEGVIIQTDVSSSMIRIKRLDNMLLVSVSLRNLSSNSTTLTYNQELCWYSDLTYRTLGEMQSNYAGVVIQFNPTTLLVAKDNANLTSARVDAIVPIFEITM